MTEQIRKMIRAHKPKRKGGGLGYKKRLVIRWFRLYDAAVVAMSTPEPTPAEA